jgi:predicted RNA-binding Zn-ribbon protein involved in translation (DUF1610 family)
MKYWEIITDNLKKAGWRYGCISSTDVISGGVSITVKPSSSSTDIRFDCPRCGQSLTVEQRGAGMAVNCPSCNEQIEIPGSITVDHTMQ